MTLYPTTVYQDANGNKRIRTKRKYLTPFAAKIAASNLRHHGWDIEAITEDHSVIATKPYE